MPDPHQVETALAHDLWSTRVDPSEVENVVLNLALNARDAMPKGGNLQVSTRNVTIDVATAQLSDGMEPGDYVRLTVSDTGVGMPREVLDHVFEPFFTTKGPGKGTGLGLSTLCGFVKQSRGHVTITSEMGRGTSVNVYLPRIDAGDGAAPKSSDGRPLPQARGETILVVEDNPQVRTLTTERLRRLGYQVIEADSGPAAIAVLETAQHVDLVFSDVVMPGGLSGFELATEVRRLKPGLRVLLTSGYAESTARSQEQQADARRLLRKPYSLVELAESVRAELST